MRTLFIVAGDKPQHERNALFVMAEREEALTMYMAKNKLDRKMVNATQGVEALHQLASSYFIDRDGTMRKLHEIQISSNAIKHLGQCRVLTCREVCPETHVEKQR
ncbi:BMP/retinoic acid-inducible neural-specific protein 1 [Tachysurus ichikawai]